VHRTIAHLSDLHFGRDPRVELAARALCRALVGAGVEAVLVTGDLTHRGRHSELRAFENAFEPLLERGRVVLVPGNHDRLGEDAGSTLMVGSRVGVVDLPALHVVRVDSTAPHNRSLIAAHGLLDRADLGEIDAALRDAPRGALSVVMLHHHVLPLPAEDLVEALSGWLGWPNAAELPLGRELLEIARGRCDLVLHGHRHVPSLTTLHPESDRPVRVVNAGCSTDLLRARLFVHAGGVLRHCGWIPASPPETRRGGEARPDAAHAGAVERAA